MSEFLKIGFLWTGGSHLLEKLRIVLAIWIRKTQNGKSIGCPPEQQAAGTGLVGGVHLASDLPNPAELYRFFECSNRAALERAALLR